MQQVTSALDLFNQIECRGIHNFSYGTIDCYFWLEKLLGKAKLGTGGVRFIAPGILQLEGLPGRNPIKTFVYNADESHYEILLDAQRKGVVYSINRLPLDKESKFPEMQYDLREVMNPANYSRDKRKARLRYPFNWLEANGCTIEPVTADNFAEVKALHDEWVKVKLDDPRTFQMMFPNKRYLQCVERAMQQPDKYVTWLFRLKRVVDVKVDCHAAHQQRLVHQAVAVQVYATQGEYAFGMAGFGRWWDLPSNAMNYMTIKYLRELDLAGIRYVNDGYTLHKRLHTFKAHYPHSLVISYAYGKVNDASVTQELKKDAGVDKQRREKSAYSATSQAENLVQTGAKAVLRELLQPGRRFTLQLLVILTGISESTLKTAISDLRSPKYCGAGGKLVILKDQEKCYYVA